MITKGATRWEQVEFTQLYPYGLIYKVVSLESGCRYAICLLHNSPNFRDEPGHGLLLYSGRSQSKNMKGFNCFILVSNFFVALSSGVHGTDSARSNFLEAAISIETLHSYIICGNAAGTCG